MSSGVLFVPLLLLCLCLWPFFSNHSLPGHFYTHFYIYIQQYPFEPEKELNATVEQTIKILNRLKNWSSYKRKMTTHMVRSRAFFTAWTTGIVVANELHFEAAIKANYNLSWWIFDKMVILSVCHSVCYRNLKNKNHLLHFIIAETAGTAHFLKWVCVANP